MTIFVLTVIIFVQGIYCYKKRKKLKRFEYLFKFNAYFVDSVKKENEKLGHENKQLTKQIQNMQVKKKHISETLQTDEFSDIKSYNKIKISKSLYKLDDYLVSNEQGYNFMKEVYINNMDYNYKYYLTMSFSDNIYGICSSFLEGVQRALIELKIVESNDSMRSYFKFYGNNNFTNEFKSEINDLD